MKYFLLCCICLSSCPFSYGQAKSTDNYFSEIGYLIPLKQKYIDPTKPDLGISLDNNGNIVGNATFDALVQQIDSAVTNSILNPPDAFNEGQGGMGGNVPAVTTTSVDQNTLTSETKYALFILCDSTIDHYNKLKDFPLSFQYWSKFPMGSPGAVGNSGVVPTGFSFSESNLLYGLTDYIIKAAKSELVQVYLKNWFTKLKDDSIISAILPQTLSVLNAFIQDNSLDLAKYGSKWKAAFEEDLRTIPLDFQDESLVGSVLKIFSSDADLDKQLIPVISGGDEIIYNMYLKKNIVTILSGLAGKYMTGDDVTDLPVFKRLVIVTNMLLNVCGTLDKNQTYNTVALADIQKMSAPSWRALMRLTYARNRSNLSAVFGASASNFFASLTFTPSTVNAFSQALQQTVSIITSYQALIANSSSNAGTSVKLSFNEGREIFDIAFQLLDNSMAYFKVFNPDADLVQKYNCKVKPYLTGLSEMGEGISAKDYAKVLDGLVAIVSQIDPNKKNNEVLIYLQRFGSFMVDILTAKNSGDVETAVSQLIPQNQYQMKHVKSFTISLSSYPGIAIGKEMISTYQTTSTGAPDYTKPKTNTGSFSLAPYLPIGFDFNIGNKDSSCNSLFIQLLDLGAVLNYRLTTSDTSVSTNPNINFKQLLSPGFGILHHFEKSPVSIGLTANYTPSLRTVNQLGTTYQPNAFRIGLFVGIDVTGVLLYSSKKNIK